MVIGNDRNVSLWLERKMTRENYTEQSTLALIRNLWSRTRCEKAL